MEKEKKIIVVSRLHQILEPFMLRRLVQDVERKLPPKVTIAVHCPFSAYQAAVYDWVQRTGTIRVEPNAKIGLAARANFRGYLPLQNRCMELRKLCNHPALNYPVEKGGDWRSGEDLVRTCGKLWVTIDCSRKLRASGHRVLLFSTMTRLLDLLETYWKWRRRRRRARGWSGAASTAAPRSTSARWPSPSSTRPTPRSSCFCSIRAAGRGLNLQTADTVVVYDPDPNPKNEEQAVARSHRIGQKREVRCIHLEVVVDAIGAGDDEGARGFERSLPEGGERPSCVRRPHLGHRRRSRVCREHRVHRPQRDPAAEDRDGGRGHQRRSIRSADHARGTPRDAREAHAGSTGWERPALVRRAVYAAS